MDRESIREFLKEIVGANVHMENRKEWVSTNCPFARWLHPNHTDRNMSFGIKENLYEESVYNCFTCKSKGTIPQMLDKLSIYTGDDYRSLKGEVEDGEFLGANLPAWDNRRGYDSKNSALGEPVEEDYLDIYDDAAGHEYLIKRGIDDKTAKALDLRIDPDNHGVERILFPVFAPDGSFYGYTGRAIVPEVEPRIRDYFGLPKRLLLLGSEFIKTDSDTYIILVEGLFDFATGFAYGLPVVASMHSGLTPQQARILKDFNLPVYVFYDDDLAGHKGVYVVKEAIGKHVPVMKVRYPKDKTILDNKTGRMRSPTDPDELTNTQFKAMVKDSRLA